MRDGCSPVWKTRWVAGTPWVAVPKGSPVLGFRSNRSKLLLEISTRIRCQFFTT
jgi:hypothetical protein